VIEESAFKDCSGLTSICIPGSVTVIERSIFEDCTGLTSIEFLGSVKKIDKYAFSNCSNLAKILVPAKKMDYYKKRLPENLHGLIVEQEPVKKAK
jgi:hypothetical protein